jgi:hypothetical protein
MIIPLSDGLLRIRRRDLDQLPLTHLVSGLDDDSGQARACGATIALSGYTEWVCPAQPQLSLGWDWQLEDTASPPRIRRLGLPRTNVLLLDGDRAALPWNESLQLLANFIDGFNWNTPAFRAVCERYAA